MYMKHYRPTDKISTEVDPRIKKRITKAQAEILQYNVFELEPKDHIFNNYNGCGFGWLEVNPAGEIVDLKYGYLEEEGTLEQNVKDLDFNERTMIPLILKNKNIRFFVNMTSYCLLRM